MRKLAICFFFLSGFLLPIGLAAKDQPVAVESDTVSCNFADGKQITARYSRVPVDKKEKLRDGKIWMPGGSAMVLFSGADLKFAGKDIPTGAYTMYLIPGRKNWILVVSKNEKPDSAYDAQQDVARGEMELGQLSQPTNRLSLYFGQVGAKQCALRVYYGDTGAFTEFNEQ